MKSKKIILLSLFSMSLINNSESSLVRNLYEKTSKYQPKDQCNEITTIKEHQLISASYNQIEDQIEKTAKNIEAFAIERLIEIANSSSTVLENGETYLDVTKFFNTAYEGYQNPQSEEGKLLSEIVSKKIDNIKNNLYLIKYAISGLGNLLNITIKTSSEKPIATKDLLKKLPNGYLAIAFEINIDKSKGAGKLLKIPGMSANDQGLDLSEKNKINILRAVRDISFHLDAEVKTKVIATAKMGPSKTVGDFKFNLGGKLVLINPYVGKLQSTDTKAMIVLQKTPKGDVNIFINMNNLNQLSAED